MSDLSRRGRSVPASPIRRLVPLADQAKKRGITVHHLNIGQPDIATPEAFFDAVRRFRVPVLAYAPSEGIAELRDAMSGYFRNSGLGVAPEEIVITTGGSEAILFALAAVTDPGDEIVTFEPLYPNYLGFAAMLGIEVRVVTTRAEDGYHLPQPEELERAIGPRTRAILYCSPGNPTGTVLRREEIEQLVEAARRHDLFLFADEVYREIVYEGVRAPSLIEVAAASGIEDRAVVLDSVSKRFNLCGARIGALVTRNAELRASAVRMAQARLSSPTLGQIGAAALMDLPPAHFEVLRAEYRRRRDIVHEALTAIPGVLCRRPEGAFYVFARLPIARKGIGDSDDLARFLLTDFEEGKETVMVAPGTGFYATPASASNPAGADEIRIAYVLESDRLRRAMAIFRHGLEKFCAV